MVQSPRNCEDQGTRPRLEVLRMVDEALQVVLVLELRKARGVRRVVLPVRSGGIVRAVDVVSCRRIASVSMSHVGSIRVTTYHTP